MRTRSKKYFLTCVVTSQVDIYIFVHAITIQKLDYNYDSKYGLFKRILENNKKQFQLRFFEISFLPQCLFKMSKIIMRIPRRYYTLFRIYGLRLVL